MTVTVPGTVSPCTRYGGSPGGRVARRMKRSEPAVRQLWLRALKALRPQLEKQL
jgi:hypothetical protein